MTKAEESRWISDAVRDTLLDGGVPWPHRSSGVVPLDRLIAARPALVHEEVPGLNQAAAAACLRRWGVRWVAPEPDTRLAGFLFANSSSGYIFVRREDPLERRRFTAAHELGHHRLHLAPELARRGPIDPGMVAVDADVSESGDAATLAAMERQANRFAAELLMPEQACRGLFEKYSGKYGPITRFLIHHIGGDLLVSREAIGWRLYGLRLIPEPPRKRAAGQNGNVDPGPTDDGE